MYLTNTFDSEGLLQLQKTGDNDMQALELSQLSTKQKLGLATNFCLRRYEQLDYALELIREHSLGSIWIYQLKNHDEVIAKLNETADYPILIMTDAESGFIPNRIGGQYALSVTDDEECAYAFGKTVGTDARRLGYNMVCNPLLDMNMTNCVCNGTMRSMGGDKYKVAKMAAAQIRGMHDAGVLCCAKHYPGHTAIFDKDSDIDGHMGNRPPAKDTAEMLLDYNLYPYFALDKEGILDAIMVGHAWFENVDPDYPACLSKKLLGLFRDRGFDGLGVTDALNMMGTVAKFGKSNTIGMAIEAGNDIALAFHDDNRFSFNAMHECYEKGLVSDEALDTAVRRIIDVQKKLLAMQPHELTEKDKENFKKINDNSVYVKLDEGVSPAISRDGKHYFAILTEHPMDIEEHEGEEIGTMDRNWYRPRELARYLSKLFPNSTIGSISQYPSWNENYNVLENSLDHEDVIFVTFFAGFCYLGDECFTSRILSLMKAMQTTDRISTIVHAGNPFVIEDVPHMPRLIFATASHGSSMRALDVLAGLAEPTGKEVYDVKLK